jgi:hypothetical protein
VIISDFTLAAAQRFFISSRSSKYYPKSEGNRYFGEAQRPWCFCFPWYFPRKTGSVRFTEAAEVK